MSTSPRPYKNQAKKNGYFGSCVIMVSKNLHFKKILVDKNLFLKIPYY
jgi:hypothetical protein